MLSDSTGSELVIYLEDSKDDEGNSFADLDEVKAYFSQLSKEAPNMGTNIRLDNIFFNISHNLF